MLLSCCVEHRGIVAWCRSGRRSRQNRLQALHENGSDLTVPFCHFALVPVAAFRSRNPTHPTQESPKFPATQHIYLFCSNRRGGNVASDCSVRSSEPSNHWTDAELLCPRCFIVSCRKHEPREVTDAWLSGDVFGMWGA